MASQSVVVYQVGPQWRREVPLIEQEQAMGHVKFIRSLLDAGSARVAGPFTSLHDCVSGDHVGLIVFDVPLEAAMELVAQDPAVVFGLMVPRGHAFYPA